MSPDRPLKDPETMGLELQLQPIDIAIIIVFLVAVVALGLWMSRREEDSEDYFLAGRGLSWWLIGFSLIAANISAEQFVGMSGQAANDRSAWPSPATNGSPPITLVRGRVPLPAQVPPQRHLHDPRVPRVPLHALGPDDHVAC